MTKTAFPPLVTVIFILSQSLTSCQNGNDAHDNGTDSEDTAEDTTDEKGNRNTCENIDCNGKGECKTDSTGQAYCECEMGYWPGHPDSSPDIQCVEVAPKDGWNSPTGENKVSFHTTVTILPEDVGYDEAMVGMDFGTEFFGQLGDKDVTMTYSLGIELAGNEDFGDSVLVLMYPQVNDLRPNSNGIEVNTIIEKREILDAIERGDYTVTSALVDVVEKFAIASKYGMKGKAPLVLYAYCRPLILDGKAPQSYFVDGSQLKEVTVNEKLAIWGSFSLSSTDDPEVREYLKENGYSACTCFKNPEADVSQIEDEAEQIQALGLYPCDDPILPACWEYAVDCGAGTCSETAEGKAVCDCVDGYDNSAEPHICVKTESD